MTLFLVLGFVGLAARACSRWWSVTTWRRRLGGAFNALEGDVFSTAVLGGFVSAFGFGAAAAEGAGLPALPTILIGGGSGIVVGWFAWWLTSWSRTVPATAPCRSATPSVRPARVLTAIPGGQSYGVVRVSVGGHVMQCNASALLAIEAGSEVSITGVLSPTAVTVAPVWSPHSEHQAESD